MNNINADVQCTEIIDAKTKQEHKNTKKLIQKNGMQPREQTTGKHRLKY